MLWLEELHAYRLDAFRLTDLFEHYEKHGGADGCVQCGTLCSLGLGWRSVLAAGDAVDDITVYGGRRNRRRGQSQVQRLGVVRTLRLDAVRRYEQQSYQGGTHESPCRHWVRPFKRRLKSGRTQWRHGDSCVPPW